MVNEAPPSLLDSHWHGEPSKWNPYDLDDLGFHCGVLSSLVYGISQWCGLSSHNSRIRDVLDVCLGDSKKRIDNQDLTTNDIIGIIESHEKLQHFLDTPTCPSWNGT
ncbi:unnamed protein product [Prunus brigantina]